MLDLETSGYDTSLVHSDQLSAFNAGTTDTSDLTNFKQDEDMKVVGKI